MTHLKRLGVGLLVIGALAGAWLMCYGFAFGSVWVTTNNPQWIGYSIPFTVVGGLYGIGFVYDAIRNTETKNERS